MSNLTAERIHFLIKQTSDPLQRDGPNVIQNLLAQRKRVSSLYVYDRVGTELFEQQCATDEYYLRRAEKNLLVAHAKEIMDRCGPIPLIELGAGTCEKTPILLAQYASRDHVCDYFPIDIDTETLLSAAARLTEQFPRLTVHAVGTTYAEGLRALIHVRGPRLLLFLGSSLGNMETPEMDELLFDLFCYSVSGDYLLLGADLHKDAAVIDRAYNDAAGFGPRSTLNILSHLNQRYVGDFVKDKFRYCSRYDSLAHKNEVFLESLEAQTVTLEALNFTFTLEAGERIDAETMWKFEPAALEKKLASTGFALLQRWIEPQYIYGLFLLRRL